MACTATQIRWNNQSAASYRPTADYLGVTLSYTHPEHLAFTRRARSANLTQHRLKWWLCSKHIARQARVQLWYTCVLATFHYGLVAVNFTPPIITKYVTMVMTMFRQLMTTVFEPDAPTSRFLTNTNWCIRSNCSCAMSSRHHRSEAYHSSLWRYCT